MLGHALDRNGQVFFGFLVSPHLPQQQPQGVGQIKHFGLGVQGGPQVNLGFFVAAH